MNRRHVGLGLFALIALTGGGCPEGGDIDRLVEGFASLPVTPADITITAVTIGAPPPQPGAGTVTVTVDYQVNQPGGTVSVLIWLFDDDEILRFADDELVAVTVGGGAATAPGSVSNAFALQCGGPDGDEVIAVQGGTGEGHDVFLIGIDEAEIRAAARRDGDPNSPIVTSEIVEMWCE